LRRRGGGRREQMKMKMKIKSWYLELAFGGRGISLL